MFLSLAFLSLVSLLKVFFCVIVNVIYVKDNKNLLYVFRACLPGERKQNEHARTFPRCLLFLHVALSIHAQQRFARVSC
jgi:hypothetical protein